MQPNDKDVTEVILREGTIGKDIAKFKETCLGNPLVSSCDVNVRRVAGHRVDSNTLGVGIDAAIAVKTKLLLGVKIDVSGSGRLDPQQRTVTIEKLTVNNDHSGLVTRVLGLMGYGAGKTIKVARRDIDILTREIG